MVRFATILAVITGLLALLVGPVAAQMQPPPARPAPGAAGASAFPTTKEVEGTVKKVDAGAKSVQVSSGLLGWFGATLEVTDETQIQVEGKNGSLADIREGAKVKASYETRDRKNVAKAIEVMPAEAKPAPAPSGSSARPVPPGGLGASTPPAGPPKTP